MNDPRGSYWRKWDLHIHTPASFHWNGGKRFIDMNTEEKKDSLNEIVRAINDSGVAVFAIMDYWTFDGYEEIQDHVNSGQVSLAKTVFPGMELRVEAPVDYRLNTQVLLSDTLTSQQRADFKAALRLSGTDRAISEEALIEFAKGLPPDKAKKHGFSGNYTQDNSQLLSLGSQTAEVTRDSLVKAKKTIPEGTCLIILPYDTSDGLSKLNWAKHPSAAQYFMQSADMFETRTPGNVDLFLGRKTEANESFFENFLLTMGGKPKPPISGSDAHKVSDYGRFSGDRITWIKADPTFEGLKQTLIEPEGRIFIGEYPEQLQIIDQRPTKFIESVAIKKKPNSTLSEHWFDCNIPLNPGLVAIIGNKGNGKSALGETIGLLGQTSNAYAFSFLNKNRFCQPKDNKAAHFKGSLVWASGKTEYATLNSDPSPNAYELVNYIPQSYLEKLCNELGGVEETGFDQELRSVIFSHVREEDRLGQNSLESLIEYQTTQATAKIELLHKELNRITYKIVDLESRNTTEYRTKLEGALAAKQHELEGHMKNKPIEVPKPEASKEQKGELEKLAKELTDKKAELSAAEDEITDSRNKLSDINLLLSTALRLLSKIDNFERQVDAFKTEVANDLETLSLKESDIISLNISKEPVLKLRSTLLSDQVELERDLNYDEQGSKAAIKMKIAAELKQIQGQLDAPHKVYEAYLDQKVMWEKTKEKIIGTKETPESIEYYKEQLKKLESIPGEITAERKHAVEKTKEIFREKTALVTTYRDLYAPVQAFIDTNPVAKDELQLRFNVEISDAGFADTFFSYISQGVRGTYCGTEDGQKRLKKLLHDSDFSTEDGVATFVNKLITSLLIDQRDTTTATNVSDMVKKGQTPKLLYDFVYGLDYLRPRYSLGISDKALYELSPGERGALLLVFYLLVDQSDAPLIIDQPEENLDNQTVFKLLVPCIKEAKKRRQIIIITHNPNLAVVCDAEQIICCSIDLHDRNRLNYVPGAIENQKINEAIIDILEGTRPAFDNRGAKYLEG